MKTADSIAPTLSSTTTTLRALGDETRIRLLNLLVEGEQCVCTLTAVLDLPQPTISRHLAILRSANLVTVRREGKWKHYAITDSSELHAALLDLVGQQLRDLDELKRDLDRLEKTPTSGACK